MWPIATDRVVWSVGRSVYLSVTVVSPAKMAEPIEMLFGLRTWLGPRVWNIITTLRGMTIHANLYGTVRT